MAVWLDVDQSIAAGTQRVRLGRAPYLQRQGDTRLISQMAPGRALQKFKGAGPARGGIDRAIP